MHLVHEIVMQAPLDAIFSLAADVERWPQLHPAYGWCRILERRPGGITFEMGGRIRGWPARWTAVQEQFPDDGRIVFRHIRGITTGMVVRWHLRPEPQGVRVQLVHDLVLRWPVIGRLASDLIVGPLFIDWIASKTLTSVKREVEQWVSPGESSSQASAR